MVFESLFNFVVWELPLYIFSVGSLAADTVHLLDISVLCDLALYTILGVSQVHPARDTHVVIFYTRTPAL